jgi:hypothetical protein
MRYRIIANWIRFGGSRVGRARLEARKDKSCGHVRGLTPGFVWSVAQLVGWRKVRAGRDRRCVADSAAARCGAAARSGPAARLVAIRVRARRYIAERRGHVLGADDAGRRRSRWCQLAALNGRLLLAVRGGDLRCGRRSRQQQGSNQCEFLHMQPNGFRRSIDPEAAPAAGDRAGTRATNVLVLIRFCRRDRYRKRHRRDAVRTRILATCFNLKGLCSH